MVITVTSTNSSPIINNATSLTATPDSATSPTYSWTVVTGSGTFASASSATTDYTPSALGKQVVKCTVTANEGTSTGYFTLDVQASSTTETGDFTAIVTDPLSKSASKTSTKTATRSGALKYQERSLYGHRLSFGDPTTNQTPLIEPVDYQQAITFALRAYLERDCTLTKVRIFKAPDAAGTHTLVVWQLGNQTALYSKDFELSADSGGWIELTLDEPVELTASTTVPYLIGYYTPTGKVMRAEWVYGSQQVVEYPFLIGVNGGGYGQNEGTGYSYGTGAHYPGGWVGHSFFIDPVVQWPADDAIYEGGPEYFERFSSYSTLPYFPIGVWQPMPSSVSGFKAIGIKMAVTYGGNDVDTAMDAFVNSSMDVFPSYSVDSSWSILARYKANSSFDALIKGYVMTDEPDMVEPWKSPDTLRAWLAKLRQHDPSKMAIFNLGKWPVVNKGFSYLPSGSTLDQANSYWREFAHITDIVSCDFYMEDPANLGSSYGLWCNPRMVQRLRDLCDGSRPIWHYIATTAPPDTEPTPAIVYSSIWASLIGGARGIVIFDHQFTSGGTWITDFAMNNYPEMKSMMTALCTRIQTLAGPLLGPESSLSVSVASSNKTESIVGGTYGVPIHYTLREYGGTKYFFAQSIRPGTTTGTFTIPAAANKTITVIDESRTISANSSGVFSDSFTANYQVHLYQWA